MKKLFLWLLTCFTTASLFSQQQNFDITTYTSPNGWKKTASENAVQLSHEDETGGSYCMITLFKAVPGTPDPKENFNAAWESLVKGTVTVTSPPEMQPPATENGWDAYTGYATFENEGTKGIVLLITSSSAGKMVNILILTNTTTYEKQITDFLSSVNFKKQEAKPGAVNNKPGQEPAKEAIKDGFAFTTTNFDDGWTSTVQEDWVEVTKGNIKVLLHYPKEGTVIQADPEPFTNNAWNILVAPRYKDLKGYKVVSPMDYQRAYLGAGSATDVKTGKQVYVALFRKGGSGWMEFISPDKNTFVQAFGADADVIRWDTDSEIFNLMLKMEYYNRFAVAASDFKGTWTSDFSGMQQLYHVYTGNYAGMNISQSNQTFVFGAGGNYQWSILAVNGMVGSMKYAQAKSSGKLTVLNNWQVKCSDMEGKPKTYHAFFSCIKGARLLHLLDAEFPGSGVPTVYGKK